LGAPANFALQDLDIADAHALYAQDAAAAALKLSAQLAAPGKLPLGVELDASVDGAVATGKVALRSLKLRAGESGATASGSWDIGKQAGEIRLRDLVLTPRDVAAVV